MPTQSELTLARLNDEREIVRQKHENKLAEIAAREDKSLTSEDQQLLTSYRETAAELDVQVGEMLESAEAAKRATEQSAAIRRAMAGGVDGVEANDDGIVYRTMASYARDFILTHNGRVSSQIQTQFGDSQQIQAARERLELAKRTPANTLSSNVPGLIPSQHIAQIFQTIEKRRPLVASAFRTTLERGVLTFPKITQRPIVAVQTTQKTEAGNQGMLVTMNTATASTYLGGGDLSWQAVNWSTPDALSLWFDLAGADYALKTEQDAGEVIQTAAYENDITTLFPAASTGTYANLMTAISAGIGDVYANSGEMADTLYLAPDRAAYILGLTSNTPAMFANASLSFSEGSGNIAGLNVVVSRGLDAGVIAVGVARHLIVAETAGAPVELRVVEPAIGGYEVGIIGAFEAVVAQDESFSLLTAAS